MELSEKLQELRKEKGLTQEELAEALFVSRTAISKWESGRGVPNIESLKAISKFFSVSIQLIKRKSLFKVDSSILVLGAFYIVVMAAYLFFEFYVVNYRPVLINGFLEASYPSSTTLLVMCVMPTAVMQLNSRIRNTKMKRAFAFALIAFTAFMVIGRLISGVHWITDIIGGAILSAGLVMIYYSVTTLIARQER